MRLGIGSYTYGWESGTYGWEMTRNRDHLSAYDLLDRAESLKIQVVQLCLRPNVTEMAKQEIEELSASAVEKGISIELGTVGCEPANFEAYLEAPRHVEVQVLADGQGKTIHLLERDCTTQRRHQKLIEEAPSPAIDDKIRTNLCKWATNMVRAAEYHSAGTVEFIGDEKGHFYFMEMNARIQVEHPLTEATSGIDLIKTQIEIAAGASLPFAQRMIRRDGCAMEARINAEDPDENFRPCAGLIEVFQPPGGPGVRIDTHAHAGYRISPRYDSMIGKVIVHRRTRDEAIASMKRCLSEFTIEPIKTTIPLYLKILDHPDFVAGRFDTGLVDRMVAQSKEAR